MAFEVLFLSRSSRRKKGAFTLVEVLVVMVILVILLALIFPAANSALKRAKSTQCMNNLRQISQAYLNYAAANEGRYPATGNYDYSGGSGWGAFWPDILIAEGYLNEERTGEREGVFWCPAEKNHHGIADYGPSDNVIPHTKNVLPVVRVREPSKTILLGEVRRAMGDGEFGGSWRILAGQWIESGEPGSSGSPLPARHDGYAYMAFCDGHVEAISEERLVEEREELFTGPYDTTNPDYHP